MKIFFPILLLIALFSMAAARADFTAGEVNTAVAKSLDWFRREQAPDGSWTKLIRVSSTMYNSHMIFLYEYLNQVDEKRETVDGLMSYIWSQQNADGGLPGYPGGRSEPGISVMAYLSGKIAGEHDSAPRMERLERFIRANGGIGHGANALPYLMLFEIDSDYRCVPGWMETAMLAADEKMPWVRVVLYPFLHLYVSGGTHKLSPEKQPTRLGRAGFCPRWMPRLFPHKKDKRFWRWMDTHLNEDGTLFDYTPTSVPGLMALASGGPKYAALLARGLKTLEGFQVQTEQGIFQSPGEASIGETNGVLNALLEMGFTQDEPMVKKAADFIWSMQQKETGAFGFSKHNTHFPDSDDTSNSIYVLKRLSGDDPVAQKRLDRALDWLVSVQNPDGGYGTWEKERFNFVWKRIGKLAGGLVLSESVTEHTARIAVNLAQFRARSPKYDRAYRKAMAFLMKSQLKDGSYAGTWFVDYLFGTSMVVAALGSDPTDARAAAAAERALSFIFSRQNADGGFSESPASFLEGKSVALEASSPAQTGLILSQLFTFFRQENYAHWAKLAPRVRLAVEFLLKSRQADGLWHDSTWTGVTFPKVEYLIYEYIQEAAPLQALAMYPIAVKATASIF